MTSTRKVLLAVAAALLVPIALLGVLIAWWRLTYYDELKFVKEELQKIPGVTLLRANGNEDVTLEDIWAEFEVKGKGRLMLFQLTRRSFTSGDRIDIAQIGDLHPRYSVYGYMHVYDSSGKAVKSEGYGSAVTINEGSAFAPQFPTTVRTVQDLVEQFDGIYSVMKRWPQCPDVARARDNTGTDYCYCVTNDDTNRLWPATCVEGSANQAL